MDLSRVVAIQLARIDAQVAALADSRALLLSVQSRIAGGEPVDAASEQAQALVDDWFA